MEQSGDGAFLCVPAPGIHFPFRGYTAEPAARKNEAFAKRRFMVTYKHTEQPKNAGESSICPIYHCAAEAAERNKEGGAGYILQDLGPTFVKIGQIASQQAEYLPREYCEALSKLRSSVAPMDIGTVRA